MHPILSALGNSLTLFTVGLMGLSVTFYSKGEKRVPEDVSRARHYTPTPLIVMQEAKWPLFSI